MAEINRTLRDMVNPVIENTLMGLTIKSQSLSLKDLLELQDMFPEWESMDISELLVGDNVSRIQQLKVFAVIIWFGVRRHEPELAELDACYELINLNTLTTDDAMQELLDIVAKITTVELESKDDNEPPRAIEEETQQKGKKKSAEGNE